ncbi:uncharacterized protein LOC125035271 [Penaeus chinensis]|uniref:uncharacterized protein LOC125035271 n=1 Tax=Penaeus chinensis TaxID=139456 RepID=UPI001FB68135|nr:uncharacterized protein LOC125035271 [Penaeus chinensis]
MMETSLATVFLSLVCLAFVSSAPLFGCQHHADCFPEEYCESEGTCRCRGGHTRTPDGRCVASRVGEVGCMHDFDCARPDFVCRNGSCHSPDEEKRESGQKSHILVQPSPTVQDEEEVSDVEVKWYRNKRSVGGITFIIVLFILQTVTCDRIEAALRKCRSLLSSGRDERECVDPPAEADESSDSVVAPVASQEDSDTPSFSSEVSLSSVERPVPSAPGLGGHGHSSVRDSLSESLPWIDLSGSDVLPASLAPPSESNSAAYGRDNPPPYCSLQPLSFTLLDPPPYEALRSPLYTVLQPPSYEEANLDANRASPVSLTSTPRSHTYRIGDPAINTPVMGSDTDMASDQRRY